MVDRIKFSKDGVYVSKPGVDVNTASNEYLSMFPTMRCMFPTYRGTVTLSSGGSSDFSFTNASAKLPYVLLSATNGDVPSRNTYCAEVNPPYNYVRIRNISGVTRTINFSVLVDNM